MFKIKKEKPPTMNPAQMVGSMEQFADAAREHWTWLIAGVAVAAVMAVAVAGYFWMWRQEDRAAEELLHQGMRIFSQTSPAAAPPRPEELQKAVETFRKVIAEYPHTSAAPQAAYMLGNALSELKDWIAAAKAYEDFLNRYRDQKILLPLVYQRLAYAQLSQGRMEDAEKAFVTITQIAGAPNKDHALYELARIDEVLGRREGALAHYQELLKEHPRSPYAEEASIRIKTLDVQKTPAPTSPSPLTPAPAAK